MGMNDINSLSHTKWNCKYHIVICTKVPAQSLLQRKENRNRENLKTAM